MGETIRKMEYFKISIGHVLKTVTKSGGTYKK